MTKHQKKEKTMRLWPLSHHATQEQKFSDTVNIRSTNAIHAKKGRYLLPMLPRSLPVCRMFRLSSYMYQKQSFNTSLNSVAQNPKKWHANDHQ